MSYVYVDESGSLGGDGRATWVLALYRDPFAATDAVNVAWRPGAQQLTSLRRIFGIVLDVAGRVHSKQHAFTPGVRSRMERVRYRICEKPRTECHTTDVIHVVRQLSSWHMLNADTGPIAPAFPGVGTIGMELAVQESMFGPVVAALARTIRGERDDSAASGAVQDMMRVLRARLSVEGSPHGDDEEFDLLLRVMAHRLRESLVAVFDRGSRAAEEVVAIRVRGGATGGHTMQSAAAPVIAAGVARLLSSSSTRSPATVIIDGEFSGGMAFKDTLNAGAQSVRVSGVVPANSVGTPLIWVPDVAAHVLNKPTAKDDFSKPFHALISGRSTLYDIEAQADWKELVVNGPLDVSSLDVIPVGTE